MSIIRGAKNNRYSVISNQHLDDSRLSFKAKGLLTYLLSKPDTWETYVNQLAKAGPDGKRAIYSAIRELKETGYLEHVAIRTDGGKRIAAWEYRVIENPEMPVNSLLRQNVKVGNEEADTVKRQSAALLNTDKKQTLKTETTDGKGNPSPSPFNPEIYFSLMPTDIPNREQIRTLLIKHAGKGHGAICDAIAYTVNHCSDPKKFKAYLGKTLDNGYSEGYGADLSQIEKQKRNEAERLKQAEKKLLSMTPEQQKALSEQLETWLSDPLEKRELWQNGPLSERIRPKVCKYLSLRTYVQKLGGQNEL